MILVLGLMAGCVRAESLKWETDYDKAVADAKKANKIVMVDVYTDWCGWCKKLDRDTYANASVAEKLNKDFIAVKLNPEKSQRGAELARSFGTRGYPHIVFLDGDGKKVSEVGGYVSADDFIKKLDAVTSPQTK
jgi:thioredoxin-related protein